ncbi:MAG: prepilin-type N-terminal cleavage/methylation domain-containing protein [Bacilli bacterium]|nr:prepilin-type N-terminal cleavage/methylation domain-containing protein [Bacilli bacterium]MBN2696548.1 prepilin-type N-terminal cleavage/methylation domain-containing protein [Bacilli bacterium]
MSGNLRRGFTLVEAIASVFIITLVITTAFSIVVNIRNQTIATNQKIIAIDLAGAIRDEIQNVTDYNTLALWLNGESKTIDSSNCASMETPFACTVFNRTVGGRVYDDAITIIFDAADAQSQTYKVVGFSIVIVYYQERAIEIRGIVYE